MEIYTLKIPIVKVLCCLVLARFADSEFTADLCMRQNKHKKQ